MGLEEKNSFHFHSSSFPPRGKKSRAFRPAFAVADERGARRRRRRKRERGRERGKRERADAGTIGEEEEEEEEEERI